MFILYLSKTHNKGNRPQKIKITTNESVKWIDKQNNKKFCPFKLTRDYLRVRGNYKEDSENFFVFRDSLPVKLDNMRSMLRRCLTVINLDHKQYNCHSFQIGRGSDMLKFGYNIEEIKLAGRWRSNVVYKYIHT